MADNINNNPEVIEGTEATQGSDNQETKTFTQEEVLELLQRETDKRVTEALKKQQKKYDKQLSLSKLDGDEREKAEKDARIAELEEKIREMDITNNRSELKSVLSSRGLSAEFADIITITDDLEASQANIDKLDKLFKTAVKAEVERRLAGAAPKGNGGASSSVELTKEAALKLSMGELNKLAESQPDVFKKLFS